MISIGMLYRACGDSLSPRLRWKTTAHKIRPQTRTPTASPAIQDPCHKVTTVLPCSVIGLGKPSRVNELFAQPVRPRPPAATATVIPIARATRTREVLRPGLGEPGPA